MGYGYPPYGPLIITPKVKGTTPKWRAPFDTVNPPQSASRRTRKATRR